MSVENHSENIRMPRGELITRTIAMPGDTNFNGDIFGGWITSLVKVSTV